MKCGGVPGSLDIMVRLIEAQGFLDKLFKRKKKYFLAPSLYITKTRQALKGAGCVAVAGCIQNGWLWDCEGLLT